MNRIDIEARCTAVSIEDEKYCFDFTPAEESQSTIGTWFQLKLDTHMFAIGHEYSIIMHFRDLADG